MAAQRCPVCGRPADPQRSQSMPFCGPRCRQIDLARWLDERYGLPWEPEEEPDESARDGQHDPDGED